MFIDSSTAILSSAAIERLFSVGKDVLKPIRSGLTDQHFEMLVFLKGGCNQSMEFQFFNAGCDLPLFVNLFLLYFQSVFYFQHVLIISFQPVFCYYLIFFVFCY